MKNSSSPPGIELRDASIRILFNFEGRRCRETLLLDPLKPANIKHAVRVRNKVLSDIAQANFDYRSMFPNSTRFSNENDQFCGTSDQTEGFDNLGHEWLKGHGSLALGTLKKYRQSVFFWSRLLQKIPVSELNYPYLRSLIGGHQWSGPKHKNNQMIVLRAVLELAVDKGILDYNPASKIKNSRLQRPEPDPLTPAEVVVVLGWLNKNAPESLLNYFDTAIYSGMRPEELIALKWQDIDFDRGVVLVVRSRSGGELKSTKTNRSRLIEMNRPLRLALERQRKLSDVQEWVFLNPTTKRAWNSEKSQRENYWKPALKACGIRPRFAYQTRHTFASLSLSAGANPMWLAVQMGHSSTKMLFERYGKWIDTPGRATERSKIESMFENRGNVPELSLKGISPDGTL